MADTAQYVISRPYHRDHVAQSKPSVASVVDDVSGVRILTELDASMVLVEMTSAVRDRLRQAHPEFAVEPNELYGRKASA
jgi:hypothetical protein